MSQEKRHVFLEFLIIILLVAVSGVCAVSVLRVSGVIGNEPVFSVVSTISTEWCNELKEGDCLPATCRAHTHTVVVFHADWCPWCRKMKSETLSDPAVIDALKAFGKVSVDTEGNTDTSAAYEVTGIPSIVLLDKDCKEVLRITGFVDAGTLLEELDDL